MIDFEFCSPTKIYFGKDKENEVGKIISEYKFKKVLVVVGQSYAFKSGFLDRIVTSLNKYNIEHFLLSGITPNPDVSFVKQGLNLIKGKDVELVLGVGGGSVIDVAKVIACNYYYDGDPYDFNAKVAMPKKALAIGVIPTLAASGSDLSNSAVISKKDENRKGGYNSELNRPLFAILNPMLTMSTPKLDKAAGIADMISHSLERYFAKGSEYEFSEGLALALIAQMIKFGEVVMKEEDNYEAHAALLLSSSFSHNGLTGLGKNYTFPLHAIEHALSALHPELAHGVGLAILIPAWMEYVYKEDIKKFSKFSQVVFNSFLANEIENAIIGMRLLRAFFKKIGLPSSLKEVQIDKQEFPLIADMVTSNGARVVGLESSKPLNKNDILKILNMCK